MPRLLTVVRVTVPAGAQDGYLAAAAELAAHRRARGAHFWVFRAGGDPDAFLEFTEGADPAALAGDAAEAALRARLRAVAPAPSPDATPWREVPLPVPATMTHGG